MHKRLIAIALAALFIPMLSAHTPHATGMPLFVFIAIAAVQFLTAAMMLGGHLDDGDHALNMRVVLVDIEPGANDSAH
jgi:hypothetical protein